MYGTMRQRKVPCLLEELCKLTDQRKQTKLQFFFLTNLSQMNGGHMNFITSACN